MRTICQAKAPIQRGMASSSHFERIRKQMPVVSRRSYGKAMSAGPPIVSITPMSVSVDQFECSVHAV